MSYEFIHILPYAYTDLFLPLASRTLCTYTVVQDPEFSEHYGLCKLGVTRTPTVWTVSTSFLRERTEALSRCSILEGWSEESTSDGSFTFQKEIMGTPVSVSNVILLGPFLNFEGCLDVNYSVKMDNCVCGQNRYTVLMYFRASTTTLLTAADFVLLFTADHNC